MVSRIACWPHQRAADNHQCTGNHRRTWNDDPGICRYGNSIGRPCPTRPGHGAAQLNPPLVRVHSVRRGAVADDCYDTQPGAGGHRQLLAVAGDAVTRHSDCGSRALEQVGRREELAVKVVHIAPAAQRDALMAQASAPRWQCSCRTGVLQRCTKRRVCSFTAQQHFWQAASAT